MNQCDRIGMILKENKLKQKQFAIEIGVTESYISKLLKEPQIRLSQSLASLIEEKYGYNAEWVLNGTEPKIKQISKNKSLPEIHQRALAQLEKMNVEQIKAVLAFINSLDEIEKSFIDKVDRNTDKVKKQNEFFYVFNGLEPALQDYVIKTAKDLLKTQQKVEASKEEFADSIESTNIQEEVKKAEEEYIKSISNSARKTKSVALHTIKEENTNGNKAI